MGKNHFYLLKKLTRSVPDHIDVCIIRIMCIDIPCFAIAVYPLHGRIVEVHMDILDEKKISIFKVERIRIDFLERILFVTCR